MKHIILLGDGMADHPVERLGGKTLLQYAHTPNMDQIASEGRCGRLVTVPDGFHPGSEVANTAILGYDLDKVYEGRGPLEAASIGYEMAPDDLAMRCNLITLADGKIKNHHGGHLTTEEGGALIDYLADHLNSDRVRLMRGIQYRHLLVIKGGSKYIECTPPHDHPGEEWRSGLVRPAKGYENINEPGRMTPQETADVINDLILRSQELLAEHPFNQGRQNPANSIWPWGGGYRPEMSTLHEQFPELRRGVVISAVDLIRGIGYYAGLDIVLVPGATGLYNTNYQGKVDAALDALRDNDFVFLHIEASDEAGHDGDLQLKLHTIEDFDAKVVGPVLQAVKAMAQPVSIAVLPDHPTPVEMRTHVKEPVPFAVWHPGIVPDSVQRYDEVSCGDGALGLLKGPDFIQTFMRI